LGESILGKTAGRAVGKMTGAAASRKMTERQLNALLEQDQGAVGLGTTAPMRRDIITRGRDGRPIRTEPIKTGREGAVLEMGSARSDKSFDRAAMKAEMLKSAGGLPQRELDQIIDTAIAAIKEHGSAAKAAEMTRLANPIWDKFYQAALRATQ
jgi:hypothetical protein